MKAKTINELLIRIQSSPVPIVKELELGDSVSAIVMGDIIKVEDKDEYDGSITRTYHIKGQFAECITREKEQIIKSGGKTNKKDNRPSGKTY